MDNIWVSCEGETPADVENIGTVNYIPGQYFPGYYFPYKGLPYLSPLVAVQFKNPQCEFRKQNFE